MRNAKNLKPSLLDPPELKAEYNYLYSSSFLGSYITHATTLLPDSSPFFSGQQETPKSQMFLKVKSTSEQIKFCCGWF